MKIPSGGGVGMVNSPLATHGELKLPFVTRGEFIIPTTCGFATRGRNYTIPTPPPEGIATLSFSMEFSVDVENTLSDQIVKCQTLQNLQNYHLKTFWKTILQKQCILCKLLPTFFLWNFQIYGNLVKLISKVSVTSVMEF